MASKSVIPSAGGTGVGTSNVAPGYVSPADQSKFMNVCSRLLRSMQPSLMRDSVAIQSMEATLQRLGVWKNPVDSNQSAQRAHSTDVQQLQFEQAIRDMGA